MPPPAGTRPLARPAPLSLSPAPAALPPTSTMPRRCHYTRRRVGGLRAAGNARVIVLDAQGRLAQVLTDGAHEAGSHRLARSRRGAHAGLHFVRIESAGFVAARKVVLAD